MRRGGQRASRRSTSSRATSNGGSNTVRVNGSATQPLNRVQLELPVDQISTSLVTLEVVADSLKFIVECVSGRGAHALPARDCMLCASGQRINSARLSGQQTAERRSQSNASYVQLVSARVCSQDGAVCDSAAALNSVMLVTIVGKNIGGIAASYTVSVGNCTYPAQIVPAQSLSLAPDQEESLVFQVRLHARDSSTKICIALRSSASARSRHHYDSVEQCIHVPPPGDPEDELFFLLKDLECHDLIPVIISYWSVWRSAAWVVPDILTRRSRRPACIADLPDRARRLQGCVLHRGHARLAGRAD